MGVWIETLALSILACSSGVTPCVGVWIETIKYKHFVHKRVVTPCVGVWIETEQYGRNNLIPLSHPAWVCGLKLTMAALCLYLKKVTPCVGVWIET